MSRKKIRLLLILVVILVGGVSAACLMSGSAQSSFENEMNKYFADLPTKLVNKNCVMNTVSKTFSNYEKQQIATHGQIWISENKPLRQRIIRIIANCSVFLQ